MMLMLIFVMAKSSPEIPTNGSDQLGDQVHSAEEGLILAIPSQDKTNYVLNWYWCLLNMLHSLCSTDLLGRAEWKEFTNQQGWINISEVPA